MKDAPAFDFYPERWTHGTRHMTKVERCDYLDLLAWQWTEESLPGDLTIVARIAGYRRASLLSAAVIEKFPLCEDGRRRNPRLEVIRQEQRERIRRSVEQRRAAAERRWSLARQALRGTGTGSRHGDVALHSESAAPYREIACSETEQTPGGSRLTARPVAACPEASQDAPLPDKSPAVPAAGPGDPPAPAPSARDDMFRLTESAAAAPRRSRGHLTAIAEAIYAEYPNQVGKPRALKAIVAVLARPPAGHPPGLWPQSLLALVQQFAAARAGEERRYTPLPAVWFSERRFEDDPETWSPRQSRHLPRSTFAALRPAAPVPAHESEGRPFGSSAP